MSLFLPVHQPAHPILTLTVSVNNEGQITPHAKAEHKGHAVESPVIGDAQQVWAITSQCRRCTTPAPKEMVRKRPTSPARKPNNFLESGTYESS
jgi:hypothetical protein